MAKKPNAGAVDRAKEELRGKQMGEILAHYWDPQRADEAWRNFYESEAGQMLAARVLLAEVAFLNDVAAHLKIKEETPPMQWRAIAVALAREKFPAPKRRGRPKKITLPTEQDAEGKRTQGGRPGISDDDIKTIEKWIPTWQHFIEQDGGRGTRIAAARLLRDELLKAGKSVPSAKQILNRSADLKKSSRKQKRK
jgi:hypothetical protein